MKASDNIPTFQLVYQLHVSALSTVRNANTTLRNLARPSVTAMIFFTEPATAGDFGHHGSFGMLPEVHQRYLGNRFERHRE